MQYLIKEETKKQIEELKEGIICIRRVESGEPRKKII